MSRWFRHYAGMMRDDKLVRVALKSGQTIERVIWIWGAILESAAEINDDGRYDFDPAEAAYFLRADETDVRAIETCLEHSGRLREGRVAKWGDRQFKSDDSSVRVRKHRLAKRDSNGDEIDGRNKPERVSNDGVTLPSRSRNAPETETKAETEVIDLPSEGPPANEIDEAKTAVEIYNAAATEVGWPPCQRLTAQRRSAVNARLREGGGIPGWQAAIDKGKASAFLCGASDKGWKADFDFFCQSKSFTKLMEGSYDDRTPGTNGHGKPTASETVLRSIARVVEKRAGLGGGEAGADERPRDFGEAAPLPAIVEDDLAIPAYLRRN